MTERPILFSSSMVRAILDGRKTVTRRIVHGQRAMSSTAVRFEFPGSRAGWAANDAAVRDGWRDMLRCPYGAPGDRLWVRETWAPFRRYEPGLGVAYAASCDDGEFDYWTADGAIERLKIKRWKPSIHMPRWASRITLIVIDVRVERLHDITEQDAIAEGVDEVGFPRETFASLWDGINGKRAPWKSNPWVWRVEFRRTA